MPSLESQAASRVKSKHRVKIQDKLYLQAEHIMRNAGLEEAQAGIKIAGRNTNNLRYADDTTLREKAKKN